nr:hypothetical protein [uncultured Oscillibacter sp.]
MSDDRAAERVLYAAYIAWYGENRPFCAGFFVAGSDTHESVY